MEREDLAEAIEETAENHSPSYGSMTAFVPVPAPEPFAMARKRRRRPQSTVHPLLFRCGVFTCRLLPVRDHEEHTSPLTGASYARTEARKRASACAFETSVASSICSSLV